jgi:hypothetical protein
VRGALVERARPLLIRETTDDRYSILLVDREQHFTLKSVALGERAPGE